LKAEYGDPLEEAAEGMPEFTSKEMVDKYLAGLETQMREAAKKFEFEKAARLRDTIRDLRAKEFLFG
jgi:excinuclease ABC subunit B